MTLNNAIQKIINDFGVEILKENRIINLLSDYQAFDDMPYAKNILKQIYADNYGANILNAYQTHDITQINALLSHISTNLGFDESKLSSIFSSIFPEYQATGSDDDMSDDNEYEDEVYEEDDGYDQDSGVPESEAENVAFQSLRDRMLKVINGVPAEIDKIKSFERDRAYPQLIKMHQDFCSEFDANLYSHKYTDWQVDALNKLKQHIDNIFGKCYSYLKQVDEDNKRYMYESEVRDLKNAIQESTQILDYANKNKYVKYSNSYWGLKDRINRNHNLISTNNVDPQAVNQLSSLQERLFNLQKEVFTFSVDLPVSIKVVFVILALLYNYLTFLSGWGWLFLTVPLSYYYGTYLFAGGNKQFQIGLFILYSLTMITIFTPCPWWLFIIPLALAGGGLYKFKEWMNDNDWKDSIDRELSNNNGFETKVQWGN